ncbi:DUF2726 domain-containing protein [Neptuniibacter sp.]|uniref:DUF2726 domain-containing protein n=1 Tax=Neptuniibacter sp. TaxID=1962643 RepID=UPI0026261117|nr:DUF2726 domain-containing protein [Neptuniibacter sp.]MCP4597508.1 DUF2726 domain-containing protein [Neptuniibacter sp.]
MMEWILILAVLGFVVLFILKGIAANVGAGADSQSSLGYRKKETLFTEAERSFLGVLDQCIEPAQHRVFGKVRVADIVEPNPTKNRSEWSRAFGKIKAKHFDYVICAADNLKPVCVIELDDKSHSQKKRQQRDLLLENVCKDAKLPLVRVPAQRSYKPEAIKALLAKKFASRTAASISGQGSSQVEVKVAQKSEVMKADNTDVPVGDIGGAVR